MEQPECPVCLQTYDHNNTIPRVLNCGHTICQTCLSQLPQKHPHTIRCPACTHLIKFPTHQGPSSLPKNIDLLHYSNAPQQTHDQVTVRSNSSHQFVSYSWSDEFYLKWKDWILPKDAILVETMLEKGGLFDVLDGELALTLEKSNLAVNSAEGSRRNVSLVKVSSSDLNVSSSNLFEFSYTVNAIECLSRMVEEMRDELELILRACFGSRGVGSSYGLMYDSNEVSVYLACERNRESILERIDELGDVEEGGGLCFEMISLEICEALMGMHSKGLVMGCVGPLCFSFDDFGHVCIDLNEILVRGRRVNRIVLEGIRANQNIDESDIEVILTNLLKEDVFVSPEVLFELLQRDGVSNRSSSLYSVGYSSDVWSLACLLIRLLVGKLFIEEMANDMHNIYPLRGEENELDCPSGYRSWMSKVGSLLESQLGAKSAMVQEILCKCLRFDPAKRPLVTDVWKCIRKLIFNPQVEALISPEGVAGSKTGCCLVLGELCKLPEGINETSETDTINSHGETIADQTGGTKVGKGVIEALASSSVKSTNMQGHLDCVTGLAVGGGFLFSSSFDKTVNVWSLQDFKHIHSFRGHGHRVMAVVFLEGDLPMCISGDSGGSIFIWGICELLGKEPIKKWNEEKDWRYSGIHALACYRTQYLYTGSGDKTIKAWSLQDYTLSSTMTGHRSVVSSLVVSEGVLYSGSWDGTIRMWSVNDHSSLAVLEETGSMGSVSSLSASQQLLVAAHENGFIKFWKDDVFKRSMQVHEGAILTTVLGGKWLFSGGWDKTIHVQELLGDELHLDIRKAGTIACDSVITSLLYWQGKLFVGFGDRLIKVYYFGR